MSMHIKSPEQIQVSKRNLLFKVMDTLQCSKQEALMYLSSFQQAEKLHPEYKISQIPIDTLLAMVKQTRDHLQEQNSVNSLLNGPQNEQNQVGALLGKNK